jgi:hypothetical protein
MALFQSALSELLDAFRTGDGVDMIASRSASCCKSWSSSKPPG